LPQLLLISACNPHLNRVIPTQTVFHYKATYTKPNGDTVLTKLQMKVGRINVVSFLLGTAGMDYEFQDFKTKQFYTGEFTLAYLKSYSVSLHPPRFGSYYFTEAVPFPASCLDCTVGSRETGFIQVKKGFKELSFKRIEQVLECTDSLNYDYKGETVKCLVWKGRNTNFINEIGQYKVEYIFSQKYAFLELRYFLPDSSNLVLKLDEMVRVK